MFCKPVVGTASFSWVALLYRADFRLSLAKFMGQFKGYSKCPARDHLFNVEVSRNVFRTSGQSRRETVFKWPTCGLIYPAVWRIRPTMKNCIPLLLLTFITFAPVAVAQSTKDKIEIGVQTTSLTLVSEFSIFDDTQIGIGGRVGYNFNRSIAAEAEINFFPQAQFIFNAFGNAVQGQFGVKVGKRFEKLGLFGKVRPGFISVDQVLSFPQGGQVGPIFNFTIERKTFFTIDAGGVLELYPSRRTVVRF